LRARRLVPPISFFGVHLMFRRRLQLPGSVLLGLCILGATVQAQAPTDAEAAVAKLKSDVAAGKKISGDDAKAFARKWDDLEDVMKGAFKPKRGAPLRPLNKLAKQTTFTAADKAQLTRWADRARAMAVVTPH